MIIVPCVKVHGLVTISLHLGLCLPLDNLISKELYSGTETNLVRSTEGSCYIVSQTLAITGFEIFFLNNNNNKKSVSPWL